MGTPHQGSGLAIGAEKLAVALGLLKETNSKVLSVLRADSEVLARIQDGFFTMVRRMAKEDGATIEITCFYEQLPVSGVGIVKCPSHSSKFRERFY